ncbi:MAG: hypothetical protein J4432_03185 [DPANN group archaeon]|nr:hypothetical protein [DPANN group archaeon]
MMYREICPRCFQTHGASVVLQDEKGVFFCTEEPQHKYKKNEQGFLEFYKDW